VSSLVDFSIILWRCSDSVSFLAIFLLYCGVVPTVCHSCRDKNDTPSEHLQNIIEKSTRDDTLSEHLQNIIEHSTRDVLLYCGGVPTVCHSCRFFYYILEEFRQCVISCRVFYYILVSEHLHNIIEKSPRMTHCRNTSTI
jgi:hypothetical protein